MARKAVIAEERTVKKIPASEDGQGCKCRLLDGSEYYISQNTTKKKFTLWKVSSSGYIKVDTANSPYDFKQIYPNRVH